MGEKFDEQLKKVHALSDKCSYKTRLIDDLGTAYLSTDFNGLDESLKAVRKARKYLTAQGFSQADIDDYFLEKSCLSKTRLKQLRNESIYNEDCSIRREVEVIPILHDSRTTTDKIIDGLQSRSDLLSALQKDMKKSWLNKKFGISNPPMLINFYQKHKDIINAD